MSKRKVYIVGRYPDVMVQNMFRTNGWELCSSIKDADLVQFTGGADVSPSLYSEIPHPKTNSDPERDRVEVLTFLAALGQKKPMAGICRGGQFLNVMCGGKMWQHVSNHTITHDIIDCFNGEVIRASSTHHQMMIPTDEAFVVATANVCTHKERMSKTGHITSYTTHRPADDPEVLYYEDYESLCFQPHPEYVGLPELREYYFKCINSYLFDIEDKEVAHLDDGIPL